MRVGYGAAGEFADGKIRAAERIAAQVEETLGGGANAEFCVLIL